MPCLSSKQVSYATGPVLYVLIDMLSMHFCCSFLPLCSFYVSLPRLSTLARSRRQEVVALELRRASIHPDSCHPPPSHTFQANPPAAHKASQTTRQYTSCMPREVVYKGRSLAASMLFRLESLQPAAAPQKVFCCGTVFDGPGHLRVVGDLPNVRNPAHPSRPYHRHTQAASLPSPHSLPTQTTLCARRCRGRAW